MLWIVGERHNVPLIIAAFVLGLIVIGIAAGILIPLAWYQDTKKKDTENEPYRLPGED